MLPPGQLHAPVGLYDEQRGPPVQDLVAQLDHLQGAPLGLAPPAAQQPPLHLGNQHAKVFRIRAHHLVELGKFPRPKEHFGHAELKVPVVEAQSLEEGLAEEARVEAGKVGRQEGGVHGVEVGELGPAGVALLHQLQDGGHAGTLKLGQHVPALHTHTHRVNTSVCTFPVEQRGDPGKLLASGWCSDN